MFVHSQLYRLLQSALLLLPAISVATLARMDEPALWPCNGCLQKSSRREKYLAGAPPYRLVPPYINRTSHSPLLLTPSSSILVFLPHELFFLLHLFLWANSVLGHSPALASRGHHVGSTSLHGATSAAVVREDIIGLEATGTPHACRYPQGRYALCARLAT